MGRSKDIVNILSKPTPEGYKIWVLANQGYVLDWMYHTKGVVGPLIWILIGPNFVLQ